MIGIREFVYNVATKFASQYGNRYVCQTPEKPSVEFDARMTDVAKWYTAEKSMPNHYLIQTNYVDFATVIERQFDALSERIRFVFTSSDPISDASEIAAHVKSGIFPVWHSKHTGGHPVMTDHQNDMFRAVHDVLGHMLNHVDFSAQGEDAAYRAHALTLPKRLLPILASETRGQNAALNYGPTPGVFAEQRAVFAPDWVIDGKRKP